ncbi:MAG: META domain-containing protein [Hyphomonadaceae bacterium]|nr:META domain-containing protein [Hyphomonadaceae bacterium]
MIQQIAGASLGEDVEVYMEIDASTGAITGFTGCNQFSSSMTAFSDALAVGSIQENPGECASPEAATHEARFLGVLPSVHRFRRRGKALELLPQEQGEALLNLRVDDFATVTHPATTAPPP